jgi:hypothetical protein
MIYPVVPQDKLAIIAIRSRRCMVSRHRQVAPYIFEVQAAENWEALEPDLGAWRKRRSGRSSKTTPCPAPTTWRRGRRGRGRMDGRA